MNSWLLKPIVVGLFVAPVLWAATTVTNQPVVTQITLKLADGGRITGQPVTKVLPFHTDYAKSEISWNLVQTCELTASNTASVLKLKNGDLLRGQVDLNALKLETVLGKLTVPIGVVTSFSVQQGGAGGGIEGLVLYYPFDEDAGEVVHDASGNGNDGKVLGAKWTPNGRIGGAYEFHAGSSGNRFRYPQQILGSDPSRIHVDPRIAKDCIQVPNSSTINSPCETKQVTLAAWIKPKSVPSEFPVIICKGGNWPPAAFGGYEIHLNSHGDHDIVFSSGRCYFFTCDPGKWINQHLGEWIHVAAVVDVSARIERIYVNGDYTGDIQDAPDGRVEDGLAPVTNDLFIGKPDPGHHENRAGFDGLMDEVMIFNRALSAEEVTELYRRDSPLAGNAADTKASAAQAKLPIKVQMELADGSHLVGELKPDELDIRTESLGKVSIPFRLIRTLQFSEGGKRVTASLTNGDKMVGEPLFSELKVTTSFGRVVLAPAQLRSWTTINPVKKSTQAETKPSP